MSFCFSSRQVACKKITSLLHCLTHPSRKRCNREEMSRRLYEQFKTMMILQTQIHVTGPTWWDFLCPVSRDHVKDIHPLMFNALCLMNTTCLPTDFTKLFGVKPSKVMSISRARHHTSLRYGYGMVWFAP